MTTKARNRNLVVARQLAMYFVKKYTCLSLVQIGKLFGNRDHTTVIHSIEKYHDRYQNEEHYRFLVNNIYNKIGITK